MCGNKVITTRAALAGRINNSKNNMKRLVEKIADFKLEKRGFISEKEILEIKSMLEIDENTDKVYLADMRNMVVLILSESLAVSFADNLEKMDRISAITAVIDQLLYQ